MTNNDKDTIERMQKTRDSLLTIRTVLWTVAGVIIVAILFGIASNPANWSHPQ